MKNKILIGVVFVGVIVGTAYYLQANSAAQTASADDSAFENDAAVILSTSASDAAKVAQLNANLQARMAAKQIRAAKAGINIQTVPPTTIKK